VLAAIDLVPSLLSFAGVKGPDGMEYDGEDLASTLLGYRNDSREAPVFFSRPPDRKDFYGFENLPDLAVREGKWKLLCDYDGGRPELYDLEADPGETRNLAGEEAGVAAALIEKTVTWWQSVRERADGKDW
jgi:uncharacterized sulfatase